MVAREEEEEANMEKYGQKTKPKHVRQEEEERAVSE